VRSSGSRAGADGPGPGDSPIAGHSAVTEVAAGVESLVELNAAGWVGSPPLCAQAVTTATAASATRKEVGFGTVVGPHVVDLALSRVDVNDGSKPLIFVPGLAHSIQAIPDDRRNR
jgi:hypothetical protein